MKNPSPSDALTLIIVALAAVALASIGHNGSSGFIVVECNATYIYPDTGWFIVVEFTHSVHKTPEIDVVDPGPVMTVRAMAFMEYGAGVPESPGGIGGSILDTSGDYIVYQGGGMSIGGYILYNLRDVIDPDISIAGIPVDGEKCSMLKITYLTSS